MASASPVAGVVVSAAAAAMDRAVSAAQYGRHDDVVAMLDSGAVDADGRDGDGCSLLQWAAINNRLAIVDELLRRGVDVDGHGGVLDETAMQWATRHGHVGVVCRLREAGGDAAHRGNEGGAAVHLACRYQQVRVLCYLLARDVSSTAAASGLLEALDARGRTPLMVAVEWFWSNPKRALDVVRALLAFGASATFAEREGGRTALHIAAERGVDGAVFDLLHARGASCDAEDGDGRTAAEVAAAGGHGGAARALRGLARAAKGAGPCAAAVGRAARRARGQAKTEDSDGDDARLLDGAERGGDAVKHAVVPLGDSGAPGGRDAPRLAYGLGAPVVGFFVLPAAAALRGWLVGVAALALFVAAAVGLAPAGSGRYGHCGFALGSVVAIAASFFRAGIPAVVGAPLTGVYLVLLACLLGNFFAAVFADPGVVGGSADARVAAIVDLARRDALVEGALCPSCLVKRPDRSKHDPTLGRCVRRFDHYCPYVANVVGERNYRAFYLFLAFVVATIGLHLLLLLPSLRLCGLDARDGPRTETGKVCALHGDNALALVGTFFAVLHLIWVSCMLLMHSTLVCHDQTTYESIRGVGVGHPDNPPSCRNCRRSLCADGAAAVDDAAAEVELQPRA